MRPRLMTRHKGYLRRATTVLGMAALAMVGGGCGTSIDEKSPGAEVLTSLTSLEAEVLADKVVTEAELTQATASVSACLDGLGVERMETEPGQLATDGGILLGAATEEELAVQEDAAATCMEEADAIDAVWILQHQASDEEVAKSRQDFVACLADLELVEDGATFDDALVAFGEHAQVEEPFQDDGEPSELQQCGLLMSEASGLSALPGLADALAALDL